MHHRPGQAAVIGAPHRQLFAGQHVNRREGDAAVRVAGFRDKGKRVGDEGGLTINVRRRPRDSAVGGVGDAVEHRREQAPRGKCVGRRHSAELDDPPAERAVDGLPRAGRTVSEGPARVVGDPGEHERSGTRRSAGDGVRDFDQGVRSESRSYVFLPRRAAVGRPTDVAGLNDYRVRARDDPDFVRATASDADHSPIAVGGIVVARLPQEHCVVMHNDE